MHLNRTILLLFLGLLAIHSNCQSARLNKANKLYKQGLAIRAANKVYYHVDSDAEVKAMQKFKKALKKNPKHVNAHYNYALSLYYIGAHEESIAVCDEIVARHPPSSRVYVVRGMVNDRIKNYTAARHDYKKAISLDSLDPAAYRNLGLLYQDDLFQPDSAVICYERAVALDPLDFKMQFSLMVNLIITKRYKEAAEVGDILEKIDSSRPGLYSNRGLINYYQGDYHEAIAEFQKVVVMEMPKLYEERTNSLKYTYNNLANCYFKLGDASNACLFWKKAIAAGYQYREIWREYYGIEDPATLVNTHCD